VLGAEHQIDGVDVLLAGGADHAHRDLLGPRALLGSVSAPALAVDDRGAQRLLSSPVCRLHAWIGEECEHVRALGSQMVKQSAVRLVRGAHLKQLVGPLVDLGDAQPELIGVDHLALRT
jgi:hypothetical protein